MSSILATALVSIFISTTAVFAVSSSDLFFNLNASDTGSYNPSTPGTWRDLSPLSRNGTIVGSLNYNNSTGALEFPNTGQNSAASGIKYVDMGAGFDNFGNGITIEFEAHFGSYVGDNWERIFDFGNGQAQDNIWVGNYASTDEIAIELWRPNPTTQQAAGRCKTAESVNAIQANTFKKYVITLNGSVCNIYINGVQVDTEADGPAANRSFDNFFNDSGTLSSTYPTLPNNVTRQYNYIGRSNWGVDITFNGAIKYVRIYTTAITAQEAANNATTYTLTYSTSGSATGTAPASKTGNGLITLDGNTGSLTKVGHAFAGWSATANQSTGTTGSYNLSANTTLYPAFSANTYNVTYNEQGGSTVSDGTFTHGGSLTFPANPTLSGYTFAGWFTASPGGVQKTASEVAGSNASVTLHAHWSPNTYNVTYDEHGGTAVSDGSYVFGTTLSHPTAPTRAGYTFAGWFASASGGSQLSALSVSAGTTDVTLHAQWTPLPAQTVTWAPNNTSVLLSQSSVTPSSAASTSGDGTLTYSVTDAGATGCSVNSNTGVVSYTGVGTCTVRASASSTSNYLADTEDVVFSITSSTPAVSLNLDMASGATVANSTVDYAASGLQSNSPWTLIVRSNPQTIASGTYSSGLLNGSAQIPSGLAAGWHSITLTGTGANGNTISHAVWFEVSSSGTLLQTSGSGPASPTASASSLANTGASTYPGSLAMLLLAIGSALVIAARRRLQK
ncbi:MAG: InlB B-repeat-containing protein [Rhodoluna sp.]